MATATEGMATSGMTTPPASALVRTPPAQFGMTAATVATAAAIATALVPHPVVLSPSLCATADRAAAAVGRVKAAAAAASEAVTAFETAFEPIADVLRAMMRAARMRADDDDWERARLPLGTDRWGVRVTHAPSGAFLSLVLVASPFYTGIVLDGIAARFQSTPSCLALALGFEAVHCNSDYLP